MSGSEIQRLKPKLRVLLLVSQILLPFGLYLAMRMGNQPLAGVISALFAVSMLGLWWLG